MAIDIRATVTCSLGTLVSASLSDDYIQGNGLIKCKGTCEIAAVITPPVGTIVTFSYTKGGTTYNIPRKLRVLSSFADPFRRTTKVELGCKLTFLSDLKEEVNWAWYNDSSNSAFTEEDAKSIPIPIWAQSVMSKCLQELNITASSSPLTNRFMVPKFDFGPGYVQVLSDLLVSESYCGYLDESEVLQVFPLTAVGGTGPVFNSSNIIDIGSIGVGQLPAEAVTVSYSSLRLQRIPDTGAQPLWESVKTTNRFTVPISYSTFGGNPQVKKFNILETVQTNQFYRQFRDPRGELQRVLSKRVTKTKTQAAAVLGGLVSEYLSNGISFPNANIEMVRTETFEHDAEGKEIYYERNDEGSGPFAFGSIGVPWVFSSSDYVMVSYTNTYALERERRITITAGDTQQVETYLYGPWAKTIAGQQSIATSRDSFSNATQVSNYLQELVGALHLIDHRIVIESRTAPQLAPSQEDILSADLANGGTSASAYRTESKAELQLAFGSALAQRRIDFSLPYQDDDRFFKNASNFAIIRGSAESKARRYGLAQNKLLLANRSGANFQVAPEKLPAAPFAPFFVQANGLSAMYRTNGTSWTMDASGVVVSTDGLFWGAVGGVGTFWFPVAPGITTLPNTPAVVDGQMTVTSLVPLWAVIVLAKASTRIALEVESLPFGLTLQTTIDPMRVRTQLSVRKVTPVAVPSTNIELQALVPSFLIGGAVTPPVSAVAVAAPVPSVFIDTQVVVPSANVAVAAPVPAQAGPSNATIQVPVATIGLAAQVPEGVGANIETYVNSYVLQVFGWEAWINYDWWAD